MKKNVWIDPVINDELADIFTTYGKKTILYKSQEISTPFKRNSQFYYVESGLLAVTMSTGIFDGSIIIKLIPENRAYGFTDYCTAGLDRHYLIALRDSITYTIPYSVMNNLLKDKKIDERSFRRYAALCRQTTANTLSAVISMPRNNSSMKTYATTLINEFNHLKYKNHQTALNMEDIERLITKKGKSETTPYLNKLALYFFLKNEREYFIRLKDNIEH